MIRPHLVCAVKVCSPGCGGGITADGVAASCAAAAASQRAVCLPETSGGYTRLTRRSSACAQFVLII
jgi:hypothetical protein